jgi:hypothetical protein
MRTHLCFVACLVVALGILVAGAGCGGSSGGNGGGGGGGGGAKNPNVKLEASIQNGAVWIDPLNIEVGDTVQFVVATYDSSGNRTVQDVTGWTTTDGSGSVGILQNGGSLTASASSSLSFVASVVYDGATYSVAYKVNPNQVRVAASIQVQLNDLNTPVAGIRLKFFNTSGSQVGAAVSTFDGNVLASVPASATGFIVDETTIDTTKYYSYFTYGNASYSPLVSSCSAPLPSGLSNGTTANLTSPIFLLSTGSPPPPPPSGCTQ